MKKSFFYILMLFAFTCATAQNSKALYDFKVKDIEGKDYNLGSLKGKKVLIVNVASQCGYTPQYEQLEQIYKQYGSKNFVILGFPANNFGQQEPGSNQEIKEFCTAKFHVTFPMMSKISVKGDDIHPLYSWLTNKSENGKIDAPVKWNFQKFLIDENGHVVDVFLSAVKPDDPKIIQWINSK